MDDKMENRKKGICKHYEISNYLCNPVDLLKIPPHLILNICDWHVSCVLNFMPNVHSQCYFTGADTFLHVDPFLQTNFMTPHVFFLAHEKRPWPCLFGLKFNKNISHIHLRLNVEAFSSNRLDCRDKWRFHKVYKFPFSCSPSCHPFWRNSSVVIWSEEFFQSAVNFISYTWPCQFSFTYKWIFILGQDTCTWYYGRW